MGEEGRGVEGGARWRNEWVRNGSERMRVDAGVRREGGGAGRTGAAVASERASVRLGVRSRLKDRIK